MQADSRAVLQSPLTIEGWLMKIGLSIRSILHLPFNSYRQGNTQIGLQLKKFVKRSKLYVDTFKFYGIDLDNW
jgi:hypothetical protein